MEKYNYEEAVTADVKNYIEENYTEEEIITNLAHRKDDFSQDLNEECWVADSVTGNASGSYFFNTWKAEEAICHNLDLLGEAIEEFGGETDVLKSGAETCDVTIRCYLLGSCISSVLDELEEQYADEIEEAQNTEEEED